jgi:DNA ligase (NAD+)
LKYVTFKVPEASISEQKLEGISFVVTGDVYVYKNRKELQAEVEKLGGKVTGSVSAKTNYLINNDVNSGSSKNKKAKELGVPIISEQEFIDMIK